MRFGPHIRDLVPDAADRAPTMREVLPARFPPLADPAATDLEQRLRRGDFRRADGTAWQGSDPVRAGDEVWFHRELRPEVVEDVDLPVLLHDEHLLVIDKPHGIATMPRGEHILGSAVARLRRATGITALSPVHRLDRATAGVLAFAVRAEDRSAYQQLFADRTVTKEYRARVHDPHGRWQSGESARLEQRLVSDRTSLRTRIVGGPPNALTELSVLAVDPSDHTAFLSLHPRTGKTHQLRVQLAHAGTPILGDVLYGAPDTDAPSGPSADPRPPADTAPGAPSGESPTPDSARPMPSTLCLLARRLAFVDPITGADRDLTSRRDLG
ncbi:MAG: pseudouridine synthase [Brachybacterium sp.]|nr:pseudouridine synthase [Brachybacterium sp.]